jgi:hypothetical protein
MRRRHALVAFVALAVVASTSRGAKAADAEGTRTFAAVLRDLQTTIDGADATALRPSFDAMCQRHGLDRSSAALFRDWVRIASVFEATRDAGWWRLRWAITNQEPSSKLIWQAWQRAAPGLSQTPFALAPSATAECDEISSLTAFFATKLGVARVGLFWPTSNHTIAVWEPSPGVRVLLPTTQIFLGCDETIDTVAFDARRQRTIFPYGFDDVRASTELPASLARFLVGQTAAYVGASPVVLAALRLHRGKRLRTSTGSCGVPEAKARSMGATVTAADRRAIAHYYATELGRPAPADATDALVALSRD